MPSLSRSRPAPSIKRKAITSVAEPGAPVPLHPVHPLAIPSLRPEQVVVTGRPTLHRSVTRLLADPEVDLVILDVGLPDASGFEVCRALRAESNVPVIFLTVLSDQIYEEAALAGGAVDFVEKSRSLPILLKRMQLILGGRKTGPDEGDPGAAPGAQASVAGTQLPS